MGADHFVGCGVAESDTQVGGALEVGEQDCEGPLDQGCVCLVQLLTIPARTIPMRRRAGVIGSG
jgi:hypothetical protein